jgi:hypothetical protein
MRTQGLRVAISSHCVCEQILLLKINNRGDLSHLNTRKTDCFAAEMLSVGNDRCLLCRIWDCKGWSHWASLPKYRQLPEFGS